MVDLQAPQPRALDEPGVREVLRHRTSPHPLFSLTLETLHVRPSYPGLYGITVGDVSKIRGVSGIIAPYYPEDWKVTN